MLGIPKGHETSLEHAGELGRWCPVQEDVEEYFRATLEKVLSFHRYGLRAGRGIVGRAWGGFGICVCCASDTTSAACLAAHHDHRWRHGLHGSAIQARGENP